MIHGSGVIIGVSISAALLAQVASPDLSVPGLVTTMTSTGVLVWYLWYRTTIADPRDRQMYFQSLEKIQQTFAEEVKNQRTQHSEEMNQLYRELRALRGWNAPDHVPKKDAGG